MAVYLVLTAGLLGWIASGRWVDHWSGSPTLLTIVFVVGITGVNLLYGLAQIIIVADECGVMAAGWRVLAFLRSDFRRIISVFGVMLALEVVATGVSLLAIAALGLIAFVPFLGLMALLMQLAAWLLRSVVFHYLGLTGLAAYAALYRAAAEGVKRKAG